MKFPPKTEPCLHCNGTGQTGQTAKEFMLELCNHFTCAGFTCGMCPFYASNPKMVEAMEHLIKECTE